LGFHATSKTGAQQRAKSDSWFAEYLLRVNGGSEEANGDDEIRLPHDICISYTGEDSDLDTLIDGITSMQRCQAKIISPFEQYYQRGLSGLI
jgi:hypothetical protein